jgi:MEMO1 family protein
LPRLDIAIVPILVGSISESKEASFGRLLSPFLARDDTFCVVSSDFCHWYVLPSFYAKIDIHSWRPRGTRFSYTYYYPKAPPSDSPAVRLTSSSPSAMLSAHPIHTSISVLDHEAIGILTLPASTAAETHKKFAEYLARTKNTICGRHPIGVLLGALAAIEQEKSRVSKIRWVRYEQSSKCFNVTDSSVSYASAYVVF